MATKNEITGDALISKASNQNYADNYDRIFGKKDMRKTVDVKGDIVIQPKQWVDLTDDEILIAICHEDKKHMIRDSTELELSRAAIQAFKEKNNGHS